MDPDEEIQTATKDIFNSTIRDVCRNADGSWNTIHSIQKTHSDTNFSDARAEYRRQKAFVTELCAQNFRKPESEMSVQTKIDILSETLKAIKLNFNKQMLKRRVCIYEAEFDSPPYISNEFPDGNSIEIDAHKKTSSCVFDNFVAGFILNEIIDPTYADPLYKHETMEEKLTFITDVISDYYMYGCKTGAKNCEYSVNSVDDLIGASVSRRRKRARKRREKKRREKRKREARKKKQEEARKKKQAEEKAKAERKKREAEEKRKKQAEDKKKREAEERQ